VTHYIPYFALKIDGSPSRMQTAVCGVPTEPRCHSTEPTCLECQAWLARDAVNDAKTADEMFCDGITDRTGPTVEPEFFNPTAGYRPRGERRAR
jgi:hypothetical protein